MKFVSPCNENNAIKVAAFAVEFDVPIDEGIIKEFITLHQTSDLLRDELPRKQLLQALTIQVNNPQPSTPKANIDGVTIDSILPDGVQKWAVTLNSNSLVVSCGVYTRWIDVWGKAQDYFNEILPILLEKKFSLVALEYIDEFIVEENSSWEDELFDSNTKYIPSNIFHLDDLWHSHHGFISSSNDSTTLNNIEINYIEETEIEKTKKVLIRTQHKSRMGELVEYSDIRSVIAKIIGENHEFNKEIFKNLLSTEMCEKINLEV